MKRVTKIAIAVGTALTLGLATAVVSAQPGGQGCGGPMTGHNMGPGMMGGNGPGWGERMRSGGPVNVEAGLAALKVRLAITAQQDSAWQVFVKHAKQQSTNRQAWFAKAREAKSTGSAPERMAQQLEFMKQHQSGMEANVAALKDLYVVLTPEQKAMADQRFGGLGRGHQARHRGPVSNVR